jgi:hypothetical protein
MDRIVYIISDPERGEHRAESVAEYRRLFAELRLRFGPKAPLRVRSERARTEAKQLQTSVSGEAAA